MPDPSHVDLSVLWVPIMPETSKLPDAMEKAGQDATESFGKGSSGIGDKIHDSISKSTGKIKDVFTKSGSDASDAMADSIKAKSKTVEDALAETGKKAHGKFRDAVGDIGKEMVGAISPDVKRQLTDRVEDVVGGAFKSVLGDSGVGGMVGDVVSKAASQGVGSWLDGLKDKVKGVKDTVGDTKKAFADLSGGDTKAGISGLVDSFGKLDKTAKDFGIDVGGLPQPIQDVINKTSEAKNTAEEFAGIFKDLPGKIGLVGTAIEALGPIIAGAMGGIEVVKQVIDAANHLADAHPHNLADAAANVGVPVGPLPGMNQPSVLPPMTPPNAGSTPAPGDIPGMLLPPAPSSAPGKPSAHNFYNDWYPRSAPSGNTVPLVQRPDGTWTSSNPAWAHLIARESGGQPGIYNRYDSNAQAGDPSQGLFQFTRATWARSGGLKYGADPSKATPQQQAEIAANLIRANPSGSDWGAGMSGRESASALLSGVGPGGSTSSGWWGSGRGSGGGGASAASDTFGGSGGGATYGSSAKMPTGTDADPIYTAMSKSAGGGADDSSNGNAQAQQLGQGLLSGIAQSVGLDGSVFKTFGGASNPMDFGLTKIGTGLANWGLGLAKQKGGMPGMGGIPTGPHGSQSVPTGETPNVNNHYYGNVGGMTVNQTGVEGTGVQDLGFMGNKSQYNSFTASNAGGGPNP